VARGGGWRDDGGATHAPKSRPKAWAWRALNWLDCWAGVREFADM